MESMIIKSWKLLHQASLLKKFHFIPTLLSTLILNIIIAYQVAFTWITFFGSKDVFLQGILSFFHSWSMIIELIILGTILFLISEFLIHFFEGGLIALIDAFFKRDHVNYRFSRGISAGLKNVLIFIEYNAVTSIFHPFTVVTGFLFLVRIFHAQYMGILVWVMFIFACATFIINFLFIYTRYFIVIERKHIFDAMGSSARMAIDNLDITLRILFSLFLVYIRVIFIVLAVLIFPIFIGGILTYVSSKFFLWLSFSFLGIVYIFFLLFITYVNVIIELFVYSLWYNAYIQNLSLKEEEIKK